MSVNPTWQLTVPADDMELSGELRRRGIKPGQRLEVAVLVEDAKPVEANGLPAFFSSFDGPANLGARAKDILRAELPRSR